MSSVPRHHETHMATAASGKWLGDGNRPIVRAFQTLPVVKTRGLALPAQVRTNCFDSGFIKFSPGRDGTGAAVVRLVCMGKPPMEDAMENWNNAKLCDVANLVLGAILFFSPWMFGFDAGKISENANITGLVIAIIAIAALAAFAVWEEWLNLIVGLWALVSPWVLGFQGATAMTVHVIIGFAVAMLAAIELWIMSQNPPRLTTRS